MPWVSPVGGPSGRRAYPVPREFDQPRGARMGQCVCTRAKPQGASTSRLPLGSSPSRGRAPRLGRWRVCRDVPRPLRLRLAGRALGSAIRAVGARRHSPLVAGRHVAVLCGSAGVGMRVLGSGHQPPGVLPAPVHRRVLRPGRLGATAAHCRRALWADVRTNCQSLVLQGRHRPSHGGLGRRSGEGLLCRRVRTRTDSQRRRRPRLAPRPRAAAAAAQKATALAAPR